MRRVPLAQLPTPLGRFPALRDAWGGPDIWIKRDDLTGFGISGNKIRKLELHLGAAQEVGASVLITCGAVQSNHCRATALVAARAGLGCVLLLRSADGLGPEKVEGNHLLQLLAGADVRFVTPTEYDRRDELMADVEAEVGARGGRGWVIPEGASDALGVASFVAAAEELAGQLDGEPWIDQSHLTVWHASSSGGTTAGLAAGAAALGRPWRILGSSVGGSRAHLRERVDELLGGASADYEIIDDHVGDGYGKTTNEELRIQVDATRRTGLIWDPTYTGKALVGLRREIGKGRFGSDEHVVFWHTGGGFAAFAHDFSAALA
jgi:D-cysteine desulfhydrase